jgi:xanthine dehydrogenase accessory factor
VDSVDLEVLEAATTWLVERRRFLMATVVRTWGSSPRPVGAMLVLREDGAIVGSVSGGCIEADLVSHATERFAAPPDRPYILKYGVSADEAYRFGLPCGGTIELVIEWITEGSLLAQLYQRLRNGELLARTLEFETGRVSIGIASAANAMTFDGLVLRTIHGPRYRLLVIGAGQLSGYLCGIAKTLDYEITVCDPRDEYAEGWLVPGTKLVRTMPDDTVLEMQLDAHSAVVALTHDPKLDDLALMEALKTEAFYVGH